MNKTVMTSLSLSMLLAAASAQAAGTADISGVWQPVKKVETLLTIDGKTPPLTAAGKKIYDTHLAEAKAGKNDFDIENKCLPLGMTRLMAESPFELFQGKQEAGMIFQWNHVVHMGYVRTAHERDKNEMQYAYPYYNGHSIVYTKGDALMFDTIYFNDATTLDKSGLPHGEDLHVTQSFKLKDANTLVDTVTIEDAQYYSKPWQTQFTYTRMPAGAYLQDDICTQRMGLKKLDTSK